MMTRIWVREAVADDVLLISQFNQAMARETEGKVLADSVLQQGIKAVFDDPGLGFYLVACFDKQVVGSLMVTTEWSDWRNGLFWWIQSVYILPEFRRRGGFRALYGAVRDRARVGGNVCGLRLYVERGNEAAQGTYGAMGMGETHYRVFEEEF